MVEAEEQNVSLHLSAAYLALEAFVTQCAPRDDGLLPATLGSLRSSDHYPLEVEREGLRQSCAKAVVFSLVSERTMREDIGGGALRLVTKNVLDGVSDNKDE